MVHVDEIKELDALVSLMDEPDEDMFGEIREKVLGYGKLAIPVLEEAWANTLRDNDSIRIESVIDEIRQEELVLEFKGWAKDGGNNIMKGLMLLTKYFQPGFDDAHYVALFEKLIRETWLELNDSLTALEKIKVLNHVFFRVYGFNGNFDSITESDTYFLDKVLDSKKCNAMSMGIIYIAVAQRLNVPVFGVDLTGHFILAYMDGFGALRLPNEYCEDDVLFYINPINNGAVFTRNEIKHYILQLKTNPKPGFFLPCSNLIVMKRMLTEMLVSFEKENKHSKAVVLKRLLEEVL